MAAAETASARRHDVYSLSDVQRLEPLGRAALTGKITAWSRCPGPLWTRGSGARSCRGSGFDEVWPSHRSRSRHPPVSWRERVTIWPTWATCCGPRGPPASWSPGSRSCSGSRPPPLPSRPSPRRGRRPRAGEDRAGLGIDRRLVHPLRRHHPQPRQAHRRARPAPRRRTRVDPGGVVGRDRVTGAGRGDRGCGRAAREERQAEAAMDREDRRAHLGRGLSITTDDCGGIRLRGTGTTEERLAPLAPRSPEGADPPRRTRSGLSGDSPDAVGRAAVLRWSGG